MNCRTCDKSITATGHTGNLCTHCWKEKNEDEVNLAIAATLQGHTFECASERRCIGKKCACGK